MTIKRKIAIFLLSLFLISSMVFLSLCLRALAPSSYSTCIRSLGVPPLPLSFFQEYPEDIQLLSSIRSSITSRESKSSAIPKVIHQIWPFSFPPPKDVCIAMQSVQDHNSEYRYMFWDLEEISKKLGNERISKVDCSLISSALFLADFFAASLLVEGGGVVIDPWCYMLAPISSLILERRGPIFAIEPPQGKDPCISRRLLLSPSFIAALPDDPTLISWKKELEKRFSISSSDFPKTETEYHKMVWTSLGSLTDTIIGQKEGIASFLGPTVWCPIRPQEIESLYHKKELKILIEKRDSICILARKFFQKDQKLFSTVQPESIMVHILGGRLGMSEKKLRQREILL